MSDNSTMQERKTDAEMLMEAMAAVKNGDFSQIDTSGFEDQKLGEAFNDMVNGITLRNNTFLVRVNDAMTRIGDNTCVKSLMDKVEMQEKSVKLLERSKDKLSFSIQKLEDYGYEMLSLSRQIRNTCEPCSEDMCISYEDVTRLMEDMKNMLSEVSMSLMAFEAELPEDTVEMFYRFFAMMSESMRLIEERSEIIREAVETMDGIGGRVQSVIDDVITINSLIDEQNDAASFFLNGVDGISKGYESMSAGCFDIGRHLYRISRDIDNARNDLFRHNSKPTIHDILRVYEVDHLTLSWRIYNHIMELETLKLTQVNNTDRCKFGLWCASPHEDFIDDSDAFRRAFDAHADLHKHAIAAYMAKEDCDIPLAKKEFQKTMDGFGRFRLALEELHVLYIRHGILDETPLWKFK